MSRAIFALLTGLALVVTASARNKLLLLSFDGFRFDYVDRGLTPTLQQLIESGSQSRVLVPNYPSLTFPSHYTMATGRHSEHHGIVGNSFYDPVQDDVFDMGSTAQVWWYYNNTVPVWISAKQSGLKVGCFFWPGSETTFVVDGKAYAPDFWKKYDGSVAWKTRVDTVVSWFTKEGVDFATLYASEIDSTGHSYGTDSTQLNSKLTSFDKDLQYLLTKIEENKLTESLDIIIVSDHGMQNWNKVLTLGGDFGIPSSYYVAWQYGAHVQLDATSDSNRVFIYNKLKGHKDLDIYYKHETPERVHYNAENPRISELLVMPKVGVFLKPGTNNNTGNKATHGWDNMATSMGAIFVAVGSSFRKNYQLTKHISQVDVYPLITHLLNIQGQAHDGSFEAISSILAKPPGRKASRGSKRFPADANLEE